MKKTTRYKCLAILVHGFLLIFLVSCNSYNFSEPQPVDKKNIYEFPSSFRGTWVENNTTSASVATGSIYQNYSGAPLIQQMSNGGNISRKPNDTDSAWYYVDKTSAMLIVHAKEQIAAGAWPKKDPEKGFLYPTFFNSFRRIEYDSLLDPVDTIDNYVIRGNLIYEIREEVFLEKGYRFRFDADTIIVFKNDTICVDLGQNAFLRKLNESFFVLNIRNSILGEESSWWRLILLEKNKEPMIKLWECDSKAGELSSMFYSQSVKKDVFYFDSKWSASQMLELIEQGYFTVSATLVKK